MSDKTEFFLNRSTVVKPVFLLALTHASFSKSYYLTCQYRKGITVTLESGLSKFFQYCPFKIQKGAKTKSVDEDFQVLLGDLGTIIPTEIDNILAAGTYKTKPVLSFYQYRSDNLSAPMTGYPIDFEVNTAPQTNEGCSLYCSAPQINSNRTGEVYTINRFKTLAGV